METQQIVQSNENVNPIWNQIQVVSIDDTNEYELSDMETINHEILPNDMVKFSSSNHVEDDEMDMLEMEINTEERFQNPDLVCFKCEKTGHVTFRCIAKLSAKEKKEVKAMVYTKEMRAKHQKEQRKRKNLKRLEGYRENWRKQDKKRHRENQFRGEFKCRSMKISRNKKYFK